MVINSTLLQARTKLADWRSVIPYLLGLRSSIARLPFVLAGTYEHRWVKVGGRINIACPVKTGYLSDCRINSCQINTLCLLKDVI